MDVPPSSTSHHKKNKCILASLLLISGFLYMYIRCNTIINYIAVEESIKKKKKDVTIEESIEDLENTPTRFYFYDNENITLKNEKFRLAPVVWKRYHAQAENDMQMISALERSSLRVFDPEDADLFVVPIPMSWILVHRDDGVLYDRAIGSLVNNEIFRKHKGNRHVLIGTAHAFYRKDYLQNVPPLKKWYTSLYNVTAMLSFDPNACYNDMNHHKQTKWDEFYEAVKRESHPLAKRTASLGFGSSNEDLDLMPASMEKFHDSSNFIFYHSRTTTSFYNSTIFRHAPITNITFSDFPNSSIGFDIEKDQWLQDYKNSKFCLVIRGDNPSSRALWRSIRLGCIPVIASDTLPIWGPILKSTLNMRKHCIMLNEKDLVDSPQETLLKLTELTETEIEGKIKHLAFAQRVMFTDHPESLFVPAFLKEVGMASEVITK